MTAWRDWQAAQRVVELGTHFVSYLDEGPDVAGSENVPRETFANPPVVLLHGFPTWGYAWHALVPALSRSHRVIVPDLLGYGFSDRSDRFDRSIVRQAEMVVRLLGELGVPKVDLVGHEVGGAVALRVAALYADRVDRLCLIDPATYDAWPIEAVVALGSPAARRQPPAAVVASARRLLARGFERAPGDALLEALLAPYETEVGALSLVRDAAALDASHLLELTPLLTRLAARTLILWGERDALQPIRHGRRLEGDLPAAHLIPVPGAGHLPMLEEPEHVRRDLAAFLGDERVPRAGGIFPRRAPGDAWRAPRPSR
jgi:pimeloyl-ACP methyl ester carboxylesterase